MRAHTSRGRVPMLLSATSTVFCNENLSQSDCPRPEELALFECASDVQLCARWCPSEGNPEWDGP